MALEYRVTLPGTGVNERTGAVLVIDGYGSHPDPPYNAVLRRYLASRYNCLAVGVFYFGNRLKSGAFARFSPSAEFFVNLDKYHGITVAVPRGMDGDTPIRELFRTLAGSGVTALDERCLLKNEYHGEYESFGLLPAIDHLQVLGDLLSRFPLDRRRLFAFGTSMGGYIALMLGKLAPLTFRMLVDSSGFVRSQDPSRYRSMMARGVLSGIDMRSRDDTPWEADPASRHAFLEHHRRIRDLTTGTHWRNSGTFRCLFRSLGDELVPIADKEALAEIAGHHGPTVLHRIGPADLDGVVFKTLDHGMGVSLRHLFDRAWREDEERPLPLRDDGRDGTDFCGSLHHTFDCGSRSYVVDFAPPGGPTLSLN